MFDNFNAGTIRPDFQLINGGSTESVGGTENNTFALCFVHGGHFTDGGGLSHTVDTDNKNDGRERYQIDFFSAREHIGNNFLYLLFDTFRRADVFLFYSFTKL
ncbi:hypothetical protein SDC9_113874 [bioreactor metagenome]|uniref:Uncharacterized protein n=1 Tax=bioreactor metagenome TaxID=1076179 RepID=A0A645BNA0_9ZZZZ